jgi:[ribosomal protein S18]-alanine N-acetyltransferase
MSAATSVGLEIAPMREADVDAVTAIEQRAHPFPWTRGNFADSLKAGHSAWVGRAGDEVVAYAVLLMAIDEAELLDITVAPERQRRGLGAALIERLFDVARGHGATRMLLEVRPTNAPGLALYRRRGFAEIGRRKGYYAGGDGRREDAIIMAREL